MTKPIAFTWAYNEADILPWMLRHALAQGIDVHVIDNWSTDGTYDLVLGMALAYPSNHLTVERWPYSGPVDRVSWYDMLRYTERLSWLAHEE